MPTQARVVVLPQEPAPLRIEEVRLPDPGPYQVVVKQFASGVCHSQLHQLHNPAQPRPALLGHESTGVVAAAGTNVRHVKEGDHVMVTWVPRSPEPGFRPVPAVLSFHDQEARSQNVFTWAEHTLVHHQYVVPMEKDVPTDVTAIIGCAVLTGVGAATTTAGISPGDAVAVVGCGGVGLNIVQGARLAGAVSVVAVDVVGPKLELARQLGATAVVDASQRDPVSAVMALTAQRGADVCFEAVGTQRTIEQSLAMTRRGGEAVLVGLPPMDVTVHLPAFLGLILAAKTVKGCWYGSADVRRALPRLVEHYRRGEIKLDELVSRTIALDEVNDALAAMSRGEGARSVIRYPA